MPVPFDSTPRVLPPMPFCGGIANPIHPHDYQKWVLPYNEARERNRVEAEVLTKACAHYWEKAVREWKANMPVGCIVFTEQQLHDFHTLRFLGRLDK